VNYAKLLEMNSFFTLHRFLEVGKTQDLPSKFCQTLGDALTHIVSIIAKQDKYGSKFSDMPGQIFTNPSRSTLLRGNNLDC
jgi:hypothetical protein